MQLETLNFRWERIEENTFEEWINQSTKELIEKYGWYSFNNWLFRIHTYESYIKWTNIVIDYFPNLKWKFALFWFDWMWRQFALNLGNDNEIYIFDIAVLKKYICDESLDMFLYNISINPEDYFSESLFHEHNIILKYNECISHKIPLLLWWKDVNSNMELIDMEVDWGIVWQIHQQVKLRI